MNYQKKISVIIPCYNEGDIISKTYVHIRNVLQDNKVINYEIIFINDGSTDNTYNILLTFSKENANVKLIDFSYFSCNFQWLIDHDHFRFISLEFLHFRNLWNLSEKHFR